MMRRIGENILGIISMIVFTISALLSTLMINVVLNNEENLQKVTDSVMEKNPDTTMEVINLSLDYFQNYVWMMAITSFLALILG